MKTATKQTNPVINQTTQPNTEVSKGAAVVSVMSASKLSEIVQKAIAADQAFDKANKTHKSIYTACAASLREGIESNVCSDTLLKEYDRRRTEFVRAVVEARFKDYPGEDKTEVMERARLAIMQGIKTDNAKAEWVSPKSETVRDQKKAEAEKERAQVNREVEKAVKAAKKKEPQADEKALRAAIKAEILAEGKEAREEKRAQVRFAANEARYIEQLTAVLTRMPDVFQADVREAQLRGAALLAELKHLQTKAE